MIRGLFFYYNLGLWQINKLSTFFRWSKGIEIFSEDFEVLESKIWNLKRWLKYPKVFLSVSVVLGVISEYNLLLNCNIIFNIKLICYHSLPWPRSETQSKYIIHCNIALTSISPVQLFSREPRPNYLTLSKSINYWRGAKGLSVGEISLRHESPLIKWEVTTRYCLITASNIFKLLFRNVLPDIKMTLYKCCVLNFKGHW